MKWPYLTLAVLSLTPALTRAASLAFTAQRLPSPAIDPTAVNVRAYPTTLTNDGRVIVTVLGDYPVEIFPGEYVYSGYSGAYEITQASVLPLVPLAPVTSFIGVPTVSPNGHVALTAGGAPFGLVTTYDRAAGRFVPVPGSSSDYSTATGINDAGHIVGSVYSFASSPATSTGMLYRDGVALPLLSADPAFPAFFPTAINDVDLIAGYVTDGNAAHAATWANGAITRLAEPADALASFADFVTEQGDVFGYIQHDVDGTLPVIRGVWHDGAFAPFAVPAGFASINAVEPAPNGNYLLYANAEDGSVTPFLDIKGQLFSIDFPEGFTADDLADISAPNDAGQLALFTPTSLYLLTPVPEPSSLLSLLPLAALAFQRRRRVAN